MFPIRTQKPLQLPDPDGRAAPRFCGGVARQEAEVPSSSNKTELGSNMKQMFLVLVLVWNNFLFTYTVKVTPFLKLCYKSADILRGSLPVCLFASVCNNIFDAFGCA